jgi:hypothetical protein
VSVGKYTVLPSFVFTGKLSRDLYLLIRGLLEMNHPVE